MVLPCDQLSWLTLCWVGLRWAGMGRATPVQSRRPAGVHSREVFAPMQSNSLAVQIGAPVIRRPKWLRRMQVAFNGLLVIAIAASSDPVQLGFLRTPFRAQIPAMLFPTGAEYVV